MNLDLAVSMCKRFEGFRANPYLCPAQVWTVGYGTTRYPDGRRVQPDDPPVSEVEARVLLDWELRTVCLPAVLRFCPNVANDEKRCNALVDFVYNLGAGRLQTSTLRRKIIAQDWAAARYEINRWVRGGGRVLPGLVLRRAAEAALL